MALEISHGEGAAGAQFHPASLGFLDHRAHQLGGVPAAPGLVRRLDMGDGADMADVAVIGKREKAVLDEFVAMLGGVVAESHAGV